MEPERNQSRTTIMHNCFFTVELFLVGLIAPTAFAKTIKIGVLQIACATTLLLHLFSAGRIDFVQLNYRGETPDSAHPRFTATGPLDDPRALPGQIIVAGKNPGYLKYNGGGPAFLCGPDNPEDFLFLGKLNGDGTRSGPQMEIIDAIGKWGANAFHFQMTRMRRCNIKNEGDDTHRPFIDHNPSRPLNEKVLEQWDGWLGALEKRGVVVHLEFYNDATDVEMMGWTRDGRERIVDDGKVVAFMEQTDWHTMKPHDDLAAGSTKWVLANPGKSYIAYSLSPLREAVEKAESCMFPIVLCQCDRSCGIDVFQELWYHGT